ncbi:MAG: Ig-like domain-containing protein, partial [Myxococcota bacterium]
FPPTDYILSANGVLEVPLYDIDVDENQLVWQILEQPSNGILVFVDGPLRIVYTPDSDFRGTEFFTINVTDGEETSPPLRFTVTVMD